MVIVDCFTGLTPEILPARDFSAPNVYPLAMISRIRMFVLWVHTHRSFHLRLLTDLAADLVLFLVP